jgi:hypothetical protein
MSCRSLALVTVALCFTGISRSGDTEPALPKSEGSSYLFVWAGDAARKSTDFLAVIDANSSSPSYGRVVRTLPVDATATMPHHTEYEFPQGNMLMANGWATGRTFIFDLSNPLKPRLAGQFRDRAGYSFLHSTVRLPNGHVLATFQSHGEGYAPGGGLLELDENGSVVRSASAVDPTVDKDLIWPYSLTLVPQLDLAVSSSTPMGLPDWAKLPPGSWSFEKVHDQATAQVQVWRVSDLRLLSTVSLPLDSHGQHNKWPAEPRLLPDGSVYVNTFSCGLFRMKDVNSARPSAELVYTFPGGESEHTMCSVPVVIGHYWIQTVAGLPGLIALDVTHPEKPVEVSRLTFDRQFPILDWIGVDGKVKRKNVKRDD